MFSDRICSIETPPKMNVKPRIGSVQEKTSSRKQAVVSRQPPTKVRARRVVTRRKSNVSFSFSAVARPEVSIGAIMMATTPSTIAMPMKSVDPMLPTL